MRQPTVYKIYDRCMHSKLMIRETTAVR